MLTPARRHSSWLIAVLASTLLLMAAAVPASAADETFAGTLSGTAVVPRALTNATGEVSIVIRSNEAIEYSIEYRTLRGRLLGATLNVGASGTNGQMMFRLAVGPTPIRGQLTSGDLQRTSDVSDWEAALQLLRTGRAYVILQTTAYVGGELRAQLEAAPTPTPAHSAPGSAVSTASPLPATPTDPPTPRPTLPGNGTTLATHTAPPTDAAWLAGRSTHGDLRFLIVLLAAGIAAIAGLRRSERRFGDD